MTMSLDPHDPHSTERTEQLANTISEAVRALNYATGEYADKGLVYPGTVNSVMGSLKEATGRLNQLFEQVERYLVQANNEGRLQARGGLYDGRPRQAVVFSLAALSDARNNAEALHHALKDFQNATNGLALIEDDES